MKIKALLLAAFLLASFVPTGAAADFETACAVSGASGEILKFSRQDFTDAEGDLQGIIITGLPSDGTLRFSGRPLMEGEAVTAATLNLLSYMPVNSYEVETSFSFLPVFSDGISESMSEMRISLTRKDNMPPVAEDMELKTYKNIALTGMFAASDPDGDALTFRITTKPKRGEMELAEDGSFRYTPFQNKTGTDTVTYVAVDAYGNTSPEARITIKIEKPSTKTTYADMDGHPACYAALRLIEHDVFTGEQICGSYYFNPDTVLTRGEFLVMAMKAVGLDENLTQAAVTGFADDSETAAWIKPYAQAALKAGIIGGVETGDGRKMLRADQPVTVAEAAVILNKAADMADVTVMGQIELEQAVPAWAAQAARNMDAVGVMSMDQVEDWSGVLTRAEAARMLVKSIEFYEENREKSGLLSWVFGW